MYKQKYLEIVRMSAICVLRKLWLADRLWKWSKISLGRNLDLLTVVTHHTV